MTEYSYTGKELDLFALANNWKARWCSFVRPYVVGAVLEVGAGIGTNTLLLRNTEQPRWVCLEPDVRLAERIGVSLASANLGVPCEVVNGTISDLSRGEEFDTILYIDVLEHIRNDREELAIAALHVKSAGRILVLAPAFPFLYSPFDASIGHHRRYTRASLAAVAPPGLDIEKCWYLDAVGLLASFGNRFLLKQDAPSEHQILVWDRILVRYFRWVDSFVRYSLGRSVLAVFRRVA